jgi:small GTP-binding protein
MRVPLLTGSKVILIGDSTVGKTTILDQYITGHFTPGGPMTVGASLVANSIETSSGVVEMYIWDTAGQEKYRSLIPMYSRGAVASILVADITNPKSCENVEMWFSTVQANCDRTCHYYVVVNKSDLAVVASISSVFVTSAIDRISVAAVFQAVAEGIARTANRGTSPSNPMRESAKKGMKCC